MDTHSIATSCLVNLANAPHESSEVRLAAALELLRQPARFATDSDRERFLGLAGAIAKLADTLDADPVNDTVVQSIARDLRIYLERFGYAVPEDTEAGTDIADLERTKDRFDDLVGALVSIRESLDAAGSTHTAEAIICDIDAALSSAGIAIKARR